RETFIAGGGKSMLVTVALTRRGNNIEPLPTFFIKAEPGADVDKLRASFKTLGPVPVPLIALGDDWYAIDENVPAAGVAAEAASFAKRLEEAGDAPLRAVVRINTPLLKDE